MPSWTSGYKTEQDSKQNHHGAGGEEVGVVCRHLLLAALSSIVGGHPREESVGLWSVDRALRSAFEKPALVLEWTAVTLTRYTQGEPPWTNQKPETWEPLMGH